MTSTDLVVLRPVFWGRRWTFRVWNSRFIRCSFFGTLACLPIYGLYFALTHFAHLDYNISNAIVFFPNLVIDFWARKRWGLLDRLMQWDVLSRQFQRFSIKTVGLTLIEAGLLFTFVPILQWSAQWFPYWPFTTKVALMSGIGYASYLLDIWWVFKL